MKIKDNISYPYPIWGWKDDYSSSITEDDFAIRDISDKDFFIYELELFVKNADLEKLISEEKAVYACIAECSETFRLYSFKSKEPKFQIKIPRKEVNNIVEGKWMILSTEAVTNFESGLLNRDYDGKASFPLGAMLAYITSFDINITICDELRSLDEIFVVVKNMDTNDIKYTFDDNKIKIKLPEDLLSIFNNYGGKYSSAMHSTIVMQALIIAISKIKEIDDSLDWVHILKQYINTMDSENIPSTDDDENYSLEQCMEIANYILQYPIARMFSDINTAEQHDE